MMSSDHLLTDSEGFDPILPSNPNILQIVGRKRYH
jgi:hypothetical protein